MYQILIVDDEKYIRKSIINRIAWNLWGIHVMGEASDGREALEMIKLKNPQIVLTDIRMPLMDGLELAQHIEKDFPNIHTIIISAYNDFDYAKKAIRYGVKDYLLKPVDEEELHEVIERIKLELEWKRSISVKENTGREIIEGIQDYIQIHFSEELSVIKIAEQFHLNANYLSSIFKEKTGNSMTTYIEYVRMEKAKIFLQESWNITEVARLSGYSDANYFTKVFKRYTGMTPSQWRRNE